MKRFSVVPAGERAIELDAENWLVALGHVLEQLGRANRIRRMAMEMLPNGTVIAKDLKGSDRFVVQQVASVSDGETEADGEGEEIQTLDPDADWVEVDAYESWMTDIDLAASPVFASQAALAAAQVAVPCDSASVLQLEARGLRFVAASGPIATQLVGRYIPADAGAAGFAVQHRQVMVLYEVGDDEPRHYEEFDKETGYQTRNLCCVPVVQNDRVFGVIEVVNFPTGEPFTNDSVSALERVARRLARRLAHGSPIMDGPSLSEPSELDEPTELSDDEPSGEPRTLDDIAMEPISVGDIALALPEGEDDYLNELFGESE